MLVYKKDEYRPGFQNMENKTYIRAFLKQVKEQIDDAKGRYIRSVVSGTKGGRKKIDLDMEQILSFIDDGYTYAQIGKAMGVHANTIGNRVRDYKKQIQEQELTQEHNNNTTNNNRKQDNNYPEDKDKVKENDKVKDNVDVLQNNNTTSYYKF